MKKRFIALYDVLFFAFIAAIMWWMAAVLFISGNCGDARWKLEDWYIVLLFATCFSLPITIMFSLQRIIVDLPCDLMNAFYVVNFKKNGKDIRGNWVIYLSEVESVEVVNLTKEEKKKYTSAKFLFNKYLKVNLKYGHSKYVYVSHYSNRQIQDIIKLLTAKNQI